MSKGASQPSISFLSAGFDQVPDFDQPGRGVGQRLVFGDADLVGGDAGIDLARGEHAVDRAEHVLPGAERAVEAQMPPAELRRVELAGEKTAHGIEGERRGALEREDRLLLVADRKHRALDVAARAARHELGGDGLDDLPLLGAGVLRLVDQHVVDAEVELVEDPGRRRPREQRQSLVDQILVVEQGAAFFFLAVALDHVRRDGDERAGALAGLQGTFAGDEGADAGLLLRQQLGPGGMRGGELLGEDALSRLQLGGAEHLEIVLDALAPLRRARRFQRGDVFLVVGRAGREHVHQRRPFAGWNERSGKILGFDAFQCVVRIEAEVSRQAIDRRVEAAGSFEPFGNRVALANGFAHHVLEGLVGGNHDGGRQRLAELLSGLGAASKSTSRVN